MTCKEAVEEMGLFSLTDDKMRWGDRKERKKKLLPC